MQPPFPCPTAKWHNDTYAAIDPSRPELSVAGKTVIVTGAGQGIGVETTLAFAAAGAKAIAVLGRTVKTLEETKKRVEGAYPSVKVSVHKVDISNPTEAKKAAAEIGAWDIMIQNAGYLSDPATVETADLNEWWKSFEINVKGGMVMSQAFLPSRKPNAAIVGTSSMVITVPSQLAHSFSAYISSKIAMTKLFEILAAEVPDVHVVTFHPGVIDTAMAVKAGMIGRLPEDTAQLPAHFTLWCVSLEAWFTRGKFLFCNWDVEELKAKAKEIQQGPNMTSGLVGWPFPSG